ncbi:hypothetical protein ACGGZK_06610 [Agromyces sp. MMS24-K17]|uniref:hypothetical protein n=1 Tax=Agromyces sp. MMS24-K17 TaxID=3372850 RepID=UPI003755201B
MANRTGLLTARRARRYGLKAAHPRSIPGPAEGVVVHLQYATDRPSVERASAAPAPATKLDRRSSELDQLFVQAP